MKQSTNKRFLLDVEERFWEIQKAAREKMALDESEENPENTNRSSYYDFVCKYRDTDNFRMINQMMIVEILKRSRVGIEAVIATAFTHGVAAGRLYEQDQKLQKLFGMTEE